MIVELMSVQTMSREAIMNKNKVVIGALCVALLLFSSGCGTQKSQTDKKPLVKTMVIGEGQKGSDTSFSGTVHGGYESALAFPVGGRIVEKYVSSGQHVTAGQPLFRIDSKDAEETANAAEGKLAAAKAQYNLAKTTLARFQKLHDIDAISDMAMDQTRSQFELAQAQLDQAQAMVGRAENNLNLTVLTADRSGVIGNTLFEVGQVAGPGMPVAIIVDDSTKEVNISLTEKQYSKYSVGMSCTVTFWALPDVVVHGVIKEIAGTPNPSTGTYDAKISLTDAPENVVIGMTAQVSFGDTDMNKIIVPLTAIDGKDGKNKVWIVDNNKVRPVIVEVGKYTSDGIEIISGIKKGDRIVTAGIKQLTDGEEVRL